MVGYNGEVLMLIPRTPSRPPYLLLYCHTFPHCTNGLEANESFGIYLGAKEEGWAANPDKNMWLCPECAALKGPTELEQMEVCYDHIVWLPLDLSKGEIFRKMFDPLPDPNRPTRKARKRPDFTRVQKETLMAIPLGEIVSKRELCLKLNLQTATLDQRVRVLKKKGCVESAGWGMIKLTEKGELVRLSLL